MQGNGFGWGQLSHTFAWIFKTTGLTPYCVYASVQFSEDTTGADMYESITITCEDGATINVSGVGGIPDAGFKVVGNWIFGTQGMLDYSGLAGSSSKETDIAGDGEHEEEKGKEQKNGKGKVEQKGSCLEVWGQDGNRTVGPPVEFEHLGQTGNGPGSLDAFVRACNELPFYCGSGVEEGLKTVGTIDAMYRSALSGLPEVVHGCEDCS
jgi:hypothetical protein